jgi:hypothetical protein
MVDSPLSIVLPSSNRNKVGSTGRGRCSCSGLIRTRALIRTMISKITFLSIGIALSFSLQWVLSSLGPLNILISSSRGLEIVGGAESLDAAGREFLSS